MKWWHENNASLNLQWLNGVIWCQMGRRSSSFVARLGNIGAFFSVLGFGPWPLVQFEPLDLSRPSFKCWLRCSGSTGSKLLGRSQAGPTSSQHRPFRYRWAMCALGRNVEFNLDNGELKLFKHQNQGSKNLTNPEWSFLVATQVTTTRMGFWSTTLGSLYSSGNTTYLSWLYN